MCLSAAHGEEERGREAVVRPARLHAGVRRLQADHPGGGAVAPVLQPAEDTAASAQLARAHARTRKHRHTHTHIYTVYTFSIYLRLKFQQCDHQTVSVYNSELMIFLKIFLDIYSDYISCGTFPFDGEICSLRVIVKKVNFNAEQFFVSLHGFLVMCVTSL